MSPALPHAAPAAASPRGSAGRLRLEYFPRLVTRPDQGGFPQCHSPGIQKVFPVFTLTPSRGFCLLPQSRALGDSTSPAAAARAQRVISPRLGEKLSKSTKIPGEQQKPKDGRRGRDCPAPAQRAFPHTYGKFFGSPWANPSSCEPHSSPRQLLLQLSPTQLPPRADTWLGKLQPKPLKSFGRAIKRRRRGLPRLGQPSPAAAPLPAPPATRQPRGGKGQNGKEKKISKEKKIKELNESLLVRAEEESGFFHVWLGRVACWRYWRKKGCFVLLCFTDLSQEKSCLAIKGSY